MLLLIFDLCTCPLHSSWCVALVVVTYRQEAVWPEGEYAIYPEGGTVLEGGDRVIHLKNMKYVP